MSNTHRRRIPEEEKVGEYKGFVIYNDENTLPSRHKKEAEYIAVHENGTSFAHRSLGKLRDLIDDYLRQ